MKKWQERRAKNLHVGSSNSSNTVLTARMFLGKDGYPPYVTPQQIITMNDTSREEDVEHMAHVIDLSGKFSMTGCRKPKRDKGGNIYVWPVFNRNGNVDGGKVLNIGNLFQFINDLYDRKFTVGFTYDDLIEEAEQA